MQQAVFSDLNDESGVVDRNLIVAIISAAIAAYTGEQPVKLKIASIRRVMSAENGWLREGRRDIFDSRSSLYS
ncbi:MAG: hypothetical protein FWE76_04740 [Symbiobacteriaceae bacterium]|nr:hypothetical protein [Symbiobacteriaceae bacterium]